MGKTKATNFLRLIAFGVPIMQLSNYLVKYSENESATFFTFEIRSSYFTAFPNFTPQNSSYTVVNPSRWQTGKYESVTSIHPRWQNQYFQPCFADKVVTEIAILHKKSGNETIFITAKNERLL